MNDGDVSRQIQQMVRFIRQEAEEKANEISVSAEEVRFLVFLDLLISLNRVYTFVLLDSILVYNGRNVRGFLVFCSEYHRSGYFEYL